MHNYFRDIEMFDDPFSLARPLVVTEFGGLSFHIPEHGSWDTSFGYANFDAIEQWRKAVWGLLDQMDALERKGLSGYVYTQLCDVEQETNGILTYDRRVNKLETVRLEDLHTDEEAEERSEGEKPGDSDGASDEETEDKGAAPEEPSEESDTTQAARPEQEHEENGTDAVPGQTDDGPAEEGEEKVDASVDNETDVIKSTDDPDSSTPDEELENDGDAGVSDEPDRS